MSAHRGEIEERTMVAAELARLAELLDAYEAVRATPGPRRAEAMAAIKPWLTPLGVVEHKGRVYWWSYAEDSLMRDNPVRYPKPPQGPRGAAAVDAVVVSRRGCRIDAEAGANVWVRYYRGRAL